MVGDEAFLPGQALLLPLATARLPLAPAAIKLITAIIFPPRAKNVKSNTSVKATAAAMAEPTSKL